MPKDQPMEPHGPADPPDLQALRIDLLRQAVEIYLSLAYPSTGLPDVVRRRLEWTPGLDPMTLLSNPPFERANRAGSGKNMIFALRLGNYRYPHMKLQVQPWPNAAGFLLSVNTHDQVLALDPNSPDLEAFRELQAENQRLKEAIEQAWDQAGLPIFLRYLREYIENRSSGEV
ncbi:MAG: hypothetical protein P4L84_20305 [Isosphaeraceae bacterium]|nr:hypothetical protein [Isosphaeraceae bacterium]